jgi:hypothetical protein
MDISISKELIVKLLKRRRRRRRVRGEIVRVVKRVIRTSRRWIRRRWS